MLKLKVSEFLKKASDLHTIDTKYPVPERPDGNHSYKFPTDTDNLSDVELEDWLLFLGGWRGYLGYQISRLEGEQSILSEGFDVLVSSKIASLERDSEICSAISKPVVPTVIFLEFPSGNLIVTLSTIISHFSK